MVARRATFIFLLTILTPGFSFHWNGLCITSISRSSSAQRNAIGDINTAPTDDNKRELCPRNGAPRVWNDNKVTGQKEAIPSPLWVFG